MFSTNLIGAIGTNLFSVCVALKPYNKMRFNHLSYVIVTYQFDTLTVCITDDNLLKASSVKIISSMAVISVF